MYAPNTEAVLQDIVLENLRKNKPFYISDKVNSDVMKFPSGFGAGPLDFLGPIGEIAGTIKAAVSAANTTIPNTATPDADTIAAAILPQVTAKLQAQGIALPPGTQSKIVTASVIDAFGTSNQTIVVGGIALLGIAVLIHLIRK